MPTLEPWYWSREMIAAVTGALVAFLLVIAYDGIRGRRRKRAHLAALRAEMEYCRTLASTYIRDGYAAPLYRLPTVAYAHSLPALLVDGRLNELDTLSLLNFFNEVETLNRGLDQAESSRDIGDEVERNTKIQAEYSRNVLKAQRLVPAEALCSTYYDRARAIIDSYLRWYKL